MRVGIVSDIHANPKALQRVLEDMPSVDRVLCAGDAVSEYRFCAQTVEVLQDVRALCIQGNHERVLFGGQNPHYLKKCQETFPAGLLAFLASAPFFLEVELEGARVLMTHASPWPPYDAYVYPQSSQLSRLGKLPYDFVILGHTHVPMVYSLEGVTLVNPGSCSQPRDQDLRGSYAVLDTASREVWIQRVYLD